MLRVTLLVCFCASSLLITPTSTAATAAAPNVLVVLTDDQGWGDLSLHGNRNLSTPRIDSLAKDGASFERFFVCPVCSPTRAEFLTGRYHPRSNVYSTSAGGERMDLDERTIAEAFRKHGYMTAAFGKWHNGMQYPYHPNGRGFEEYYGFCSGHWGNYFSPPLEHNGKLVRGKGFVIDDFTDRAIAFMRSAQRKGKPFFAYLPFNTPHSPMQVPERFYKKFANAALAMHNRDPQKENLGHIRAALAMCENIDWNVGRLLDAIDEMSIKEETIVVFFCDNGPNGVRWNGDMKGRKGSTDEGGVRSPLLIRWPGTISANKRIQPIAAAIDLLPTLTDLAGITPIGDKPLDGVSLKPLLLQARTPENWSDRLIVSHWRNRVSVRSQTHRLDHQGKLFDMRSDPGQRKNIAGEQSGIAERLKAAANDYRHQVLSQAVKDQRPFLIGHPDYRYTQLPARDAVAHGGIERSNRFPNCSFFTHWTSPQDSITWDAEVLASGNYEVEMYYTCPPDSVGAKLELSFGESRLTAAIAKPHAPPLRGHEHDRVKRQESYVKDFAPVTLGTIHLSKGQGKLTLRATAVPGAEVGEFRLLMFTRKQARE